MPEKIKILYIDDEELNLELFEWLFSDKYHVVTECCGKSGLECLQKHQDIKVVISDMNMPQMSGLEFITIAKKKYDDKKYFILTGYGVTKEIEEAIKSNLIHAYFSKPLDIEEINELVNEAVQ